MSLRIFDVHLKDYSMYDSQKLCFEMDVVFFFEVYDVEAVFEKVENETELERVLQDALKSTARKVIGTKSLEFIVSSERELKEEIKRGLLIVCKSMGILFHNIEIMNIKDIEGYREKYDYVKNARAKIKEREETKIRHGVTGIDELPYYERQNKVIQQKLSGTVGKNTEKSSTGTIETTKLLSVGKKYENKTVREDVVSTKRGGVLFSKSELM